MFDTMVVLSSQTIGSSWQSDSEYFCKCNHLIRVATAANRLIAFEYNESAAEPIGNCLNLRIRQSEVFRHPSHERWFDNAESFYLMGEAIGKQMLKLLR